MFATLICSFNQTARSWSWRSGLCDRYWPSAPIRIFTRTLNFFDQWRSTSSRWASCKPIPRRSWQTLHQGCTSVLCVWNSFHYPRGAHSCVRREEMFIRFRGLAKPYATDNTRVCSTPSDSISNPSTGRHGFPKQSSNAACSEVDFHVVPFKQPYCVSHQPRPHVHGGCHFQRGTCFQLEIESDLPLRLVLGQLHRCFDC